LREGEQERISQYINGKLSYMHFRLPEECLPWEEIEVEFQRVKLCSGALFQCAKELQEIINEVKE